MPELHNTIMGRKLIEHTLPEIVKQLERIANALENKKKENDIGNRIQSFKTYVDSYSNDKELGKKIREIWEE